MSYFTSQFPRIFTLLPLTKTRRMKIIGKIFGKKLANLWEWALSQNLSKCVHSNYAPQRIERWYGFGSNLQSLKNGKAQIFPADRPSNQIITLGNELYPGWNSLLVCGGDTSINWHFDHGHFIGKAIMINLGEAIYRECNKSQGYKPLKWNDHQLTDGLIVEIDTKLLHSAEQISNVRYNLTWRQFKPEYLEQMEF